MARRQRAHDRPAEGFTKLQLMDAGGISAKTFDLIRKAARVRGPSHGGLAWVFSREDVLALIHRARSGTFTERGPSAAAGWEGLLHDGESEHQRPRASGPEEIA